MPCLVRIDCCGEYLKCLPHIPVLCAIYLPMSVVGWWLLGDKVGESVVDSLCDGPVIFEDAQIVFLLPL